MQEATYCPEDNKLRLYMGHVPRDEYEALRAEGWKSTPKQDCDFVAAWTPSRADRALGYSEGLIGDEDQPPTDRAADRAERFGGYLDKRRAEAHGHADGYDAGPRAHGYQNAQRAERSAARHDRTANRAVDCWSKAEYWQQRTAGVISHALYVSAPGVRMGRIKRIEADLRKACGPRWRVHLELRLSYERQMLEAQGGRAGELDIEPGGYIDGTLIVKVNKSNVTGRVVSAHVKVKHIDDWHYQIRNVKGADYALMQVDVERMAPGRYTAPSEADRESFKVWKAADSRRRKAGKPKAPPLVNPTEKDAQRLQDAINKRREALVAVGRHIGGDEIWLKICEITQERYSGASKGSYATAETRELAGGGQVFPRHSDLYNGERAKRIKAMGPVVCKVRMLKDRVIVLTDKPQKVLPAAVWAAPKVKAEASSVS